ncbi:hypothetical protein NBO_40g0004 [Nosema bombycis CQ1]|uniref:Uncharacterized protein n=1 Tax=Nosema bombycis (strain CQ1 / CVCC 102059) TaxID=578461 RepID=R0MMJ3_NOSB1|nr:hypothetical protein NBO_40g0004 [Nosema bombycis CQ1]|eukprot:EOB14083.1 hypothetical protein NBO_40g0004 [Nosema bombycis CQ1]
MFIGWCTFLYKTSSKIFHIANKVTNKKKYAIEYKDIKADFEVNLNCLKQPPNPIEKFNERVLSVKDKSLIIACDIPTLGIELMFHLLFVFKNVPLKVPFCVKYEKFNEYFNNLCNHTEWMGQVIKTNPILSNFTIIENIHEVKKPSIVFIHSSYVYELNSNNYEILTVGEIMNNSFFGKDNPKDCYDFMFLDVYHYLKDSLINDQIYSINLEEETTNVTLKNTLNDYDGEYFYLSGCMISTDKNTPNIISKSIENFNASMLTSLFENEVYFYHEGFYFFPGYDFKICEREDKTYQIIKF